MEAWNFNILKRKKLRGLNDEKSISYRLKHQKHQQIKSYKKCGIVLCRAEWSWLGLAGFGSAWLLYTTVIQQDPTAELTIKIKKEKAATTSQKSLTASMALKIEWVLCGWNAFIVELLMFKTDNLKFYDEKYLRFFQHHQRIKNVQRQPSKRINFSGIRCWHCCPKSQKMPHNLVESSSSRLWLQYFRENGMSWRAGSGDC